jgi:lipopolysaccharide/colanic/teichoic acid biosynthesis glycosyltransferase
MAVERTSAVQQRIEWTRGDLQRRPDDRTSMVSSGCMMSERLFQDVLLRERKRADRSHLTLALLAVTLDDHKCHDRAMWSAVIEAAGHATRETDVVGWLQTDRMLGIILTEISAGDAAICRELDGRIRRELERRSPSKEVDAVSLRLYVYPDSTTDETEGVWPVEPLLDGVCARESQTKVYQRTKRGLDVLASAILLAVLSPLMLLIAGLIKLRSRGPALFKQVRVGQRAKPFHMLKFRTMHVNADDGIHQAFVTSLINAKPTNGVFKIVNDPRVTGIGRLLRKTSLDELPQLWNVLRGEMSLVGPRPPLPYEVKQYKAWHRRRVLEAKPGITGLWQVTGRSRTTFDDMVRLDLRYARTRSLWTDVKILLATPAAVIAGKGAS